MCPPGSSSSRWGWPCCARWRRAASTRTPRGALYVKTCTDGTLRSFAETEAETARTFEEVRALAQDHPDRGDLVDAAERQRRGMYERFPMLEGLDGRWWYQPCRYF